jgi:hypothetical protein
LIIFSLQVKNKPHDGLANCAFILELGVVMNIYYCQNLCRIAVVWPGRVIVALDGFRKLPKT